MSEREFTDAEKSRGGDRLEEMRENNRAVEQSINAVPPKPEGATIDPKLLEQREATKKAERDLANRSSLKPPPIPW